MTFNGVFKIAPTQRYPSYRGTRPGRTPEGVANDPIGDVAAAAACVLHLQRGVSLPRTRLCSPAVRPPCAARRRVAAHRERRRGVCLVAPSLAPDRATRC